MDVSQGDLYLGRYLETNDPVIYPSDVLTTHGVIVGMTGSGKTGLGIGLIEEALLNGIPCLVIDPKGDMGNLALNFPELRPADFEPWIDEAAARSEGKSVAEAAEATAESWRKGLQDDDIGSERMSRLRDNAEITIYTPGSGAGVGLNVLGSLDAPKLDWATGSEVIRDEISSFVSSLLILAGLDSDPVSGREHILLATIVEEFWRKGKTIDLATLVSQIPKPPFAKLGVFEVDTFFPEKDRMQLALGLNGLLASPSFASWMQGQALDIETMIGGDRPKAAIVYMAHLADEERQFLVTLLLAKSVTWIRTQPGTSQLRAMIYMDEVFGFAPPVKEPPSKKPILTIMKQARAHGVGMVLSTQNPVDLDYKAMANAGTWMIGRLQTANDKKRILEGLASATGEVDIGLIDKQISDLAKREFVLHSTKQPGPRLFGTRWAMSYLAGPLTKDQVATLMEGRRDESPPTDERPADPVPGPGLESDDADLSPPEIAEGITVSYLDPAAAWASKLGADPTGKVYEPAAAATVHLLYDEARADLDHRETYEAVIFPLDGVVDPGEVIAVDHDVRDYLEAPPPGATFRVSDAPIETKTFWKGVESDLRDHLIANRPLEIQVNTELGLYSRVDESEDEFQKRCLEVAEQVADAELAKSRDRYQTRIERLNDELATAEARFQEADAVAAAKSQETVLGTAGDLLGAFLGGRSGSTALSKAARRRTAAAKAEAKADTAEEMFHSKHAELVALEDELAKEVDRIVTESRGRAGNIERLEVGLEKDDIRIVEVRLVWVPVA